MSPTSIEGLIPQASISMREWLCLDWSDPTVQLEQKQVLRAAAWRQILDVTDLSRVKTWYDDPSPPCNESHRLWVNNQRDAKASDLLLVLSLDTLGSIDDGIRCFLSDTFPLPEREIWVRRFRSDLMVEVLTILPSEFMESPPPDMKRDGSERQFIESTHLRWIWVICCFWKHILEEGQRLQSQERWASLSLLISWGATPVMSRCLKMTSDPHSSHRHWLSLAFPSCFTWSRRHSVLVRTLYAVAPCSPFWGFHYVEQQKRWDGFLRCFTIHKRVSVNITNENYEIEIIKPLSEVVGTRKEGSNKRKRTSAEEESRPIEVSPEREPFQRDKQRETLQQTNEEELEQTKEAFAKANETLQKMSEWFKQANKEGKETKEELQQTKEELQQTKEELQQTKEELQQTKEELQQTKEELEQTKEELQNANEKLEQSKEKWKEANETWKQRIEEEASRRTFTWQKGTKEMLRETIQSAWTDELEQWESQRQGIWKQTTETMLRSVREEWNERTTEFQTKETERWERMEQILDMERRKRDEEEAKKEAERQRKRDEAFFQKENTLKHMIAEERQWITDVQNQFKSRVIQTLRALMEQNNKEVLQKIEGAERQRKQEKEERKRKKEKERKQKEVEERVQKRIEEEVERRVGEEKEKRMEEERKQRKEREEQASSLLFNCLNDDLLSPSREPEGAVDSSLGMPLLP